ncbi:MAG: hypothetical protein U9N62_00800 [Thermotogota bacterium]|nr:hypothetical protein [Thermotogota bacterium]
MKKMMILIMGLMFLSVFSREFLIIYPNGLSIKGDSIVVNSDNFQLDIPDSWIADSFTSDPYPQSYQYVVQKSFDYSDTLKESIGKKIKWRFEDSTIKEYMLLLDDPLLLSDENGIFSPQSGTAVFDGVQIKEPQQYLDLLFTNEIKQLSFSYMFSNLSYSTVYTMNLDDEKEQAEIIGTIIINNKTKKQIQTDHLYIFSGEINTVSTDYAVKASRSFNYEADSYSGGSAMESFSDYKIYSIPGPYSFNRFSIDYIQFLQTKESYDMIYTFNAYYSNRSTEFQTLDQTIKFSKLSLPLMAGKVRIQKNDQEKTVFLGENTINNTSKDQPLEISFGKAYDIQGKVELIQSNRSGSTYFEAYKFTAKNYAAEDKNIQLNFTIPRDSDVEVDVYDYSRPTATLLQIPLTLHGKMQVEVTFEIRYDR